MRRGPLIAGLALLPFGWVVAAIGHGMTAHMIGHMTAVAVAAPLLAWGLEGGALDPARRWPRLVSPLAMMGVEAAVVWGWHLPALRRLADASAGAMLIEQAMFAVAGLLLWAAVLGAGRDRRAAGIGALLLTSMHMTLLGALLTLAPRPLYDAMGHGIEDQQLGGVVMLVIGAASYLAGGLALLGLLLGERERAR